MKQKTQITRDKVAAVISSITANRLFFILIVLLASLQGLWYALSFHPWIYDEGRHFANIEIYTTTFSPFIYDQKTSWDYLGQVTRDGSYLFYYLMSFPLRLIQLFTENYMHQVIGLRVVCLAMFVGSLFIFRKTMQKIPGLSDSLINISLLFFVLTPAAGILGGIINYDNLTLLLFAMMLFIGINILKSNKLKLDVILVFFATGILMTLVKWTSVALVVPMMAFIIYAIVMRYKKDSLSSLLSAWRNFTLKKKAAYALIIIVPVALFIERPVVNVVMYNGPAPSCDAVISTERCQAFKDYVIYKQLKESKDPGFQPVDVFTYITHFWGPTMTNTSTNLLERGSSSQLPLMKSLYGSIFIAGLVCFLLAFRDLIKNKLRLFLIFCALSYIAILIIDGYARVYMNYGVPSAIRARYLVPVIPILGVFVLYSLRLILNKYKFEQALVGLIILTLLSQGGSIVTHLFTVPREAYWNSDTANLNESVKDLADPLVKD